MAANMTVETQIGQRIRQARIHAGLSQEELGKRLGYSGAHVSNMERGLRRITAADLLRFAHILGRNVSYFCGEKTPGEPALPFFERADVPTLRALPPSAKLAIFDALVEQIEKLLGAAPDTKDEEA